MGFISWILLGAVAGRLAAIIMGKHGKMSLMTNIIIGVIGSSIGGFLFSIIGLHGATGFNLYSIFVSVIGAVALLYIANLITKK